MAKQASRHEIRYVYRGDVERGTGRGYRWHEGYSEDLPGRVSYPWLTKTEAQTDAKSRNGRAVFVDRRGEALRAALPPAVEPAKKSHAQVKREINEILARKPSSAVREPITEVVFRAFPEGDVIALFPQDQQGAGMINSYQHLGQHGEASQGLIKELRRASPAEYAPLLTELKSIGYRLRVK